MNVDLFGEPVDLSRRFVRRPFTFFSYFGSKWRSAPHYPAPQHAHIIEPFAGSAGYATRYYGSEVWLCDADPVIRGLWAYLIDADVERIRALPDVPVGGVLDDLSDLTPDERALIGFWINLSTTTPRQTPIKWCRDEQRSDLWGPALRERLAAQLPFIRHWKVLEATTYLDIPNVEATWFIDPPYQDQGKQYRCNTIDYRELAEWCLSRKGQVIVCENAGADWLPFREFQTFQSMSVRSDGEAIDDRLRQTREVIWTNATDDVVSLW